MINKLLTNKMLTKYILAQPSSLYLFVTAVIMLAIFLALIATQLDDFHQLTAVAPHPLPILDH